MISNIREINVSNKFKRRHRRRMPGVQVTSKVSTSACKGVLSRDCLWLLLCHSVEVVLKVSAGSSDHISAAQK